MSDWKEGALTVLPDDWALVAVGDRKAPYMAGWQGLKLTKADIAAENGQCRAVGVLCGPASGGLLFLDEDGPSAAQLLAEIADGRPLPPTVTVTSGRPGRQQRIYRVPEQYWPAIRTTKRRTEAGEFLEFRWAGAQSVVAGYHPETGAYRWVEGFSPADVPIAEAPVWLIEQMLPESATASNDLPLLDAGRPFELTDLLTREHREAAQAGMAEGQRDDMGAAIAIDAVGVVRYCDLMGHPLEGTPEAVLRDYARACSPPMGDADVRRWLRSAERRQPAPAEGIENRIRYQQRKTRDEQEPRRNDRVGSPAAAPSNPAASKVDLMEGYDQFQAALVGAMAEDDLNRRTYLFTRIAQQYRLSLPVVRDIAEQAIDPSRAASTGVEPMSDDDLFTHRDDEAVQFTIPGLVPVGECVLLAGEAKSGKTLLANEMIHATLTGGEFLGEPCRKGRVLLLQLEERASLKPRLIRKGILVPENRGRFRVIRGFDATSQKALQALRREIEAFQPLLVVIDSIRGMMANSDVDENSPLFARPVKRVIRVCQDANASLVLIHHTNKNPQAQGNDMISGTKALIGETWGSLILTRLSQDEASPERCLSLRPRDGSGLRMKIALHVEEDKPPTWLHISNMAGDPTSPRLRQRILALLQEAGELRTGEVCLQFEHDSESTVRQALYRLRDKGLVITRRENNSPNGRPPTFWSINAEHFDQGVAVDTPTGTRQAFPCVDTNAAHTPPPPAPDQDPNVTKPLTQAHTRESFVTFDSVNGLGGEGTPSTPRDPDVTKPPTVDPFVEQAGRTVYRTDVKPEGWRQLQARDEPSVDADGRPIEVGALYGWLNSPHPQPGLVERVDGGRAVFNNGRAQWVPVSELFRAD